MWHNNEKSAITQANLDEYLKELAKEYRKLAGKKMPAEIILVGGAAVLAKYGFRELTYDMDAIIFAAGAMKDAITNIRNKYNLPHDWLNADFRKTTSYSDKLLEVSIYYKTFSNVLTIRVITAEYLLAMKLMSGRDYKFDLSDIVGILREHKIENNPISREDVEKALVKLYGENIELSEASIELLDIAFDNENYDALYINTRNREIETKKRQLATKEEAGLLKEESVSYAISTQDQEQQIKQKQSFLEKLEEKRNNKV